jgi:hypothetical protein
MSVRYYAFELGTEERSIADEAADLVRRIIYAPTILASASVGTVKLVATEPALQEELDLDVPGPKFELNVEIESEREEDSDKVVAVIVGELEKRGVRVRLAAIRESEPDATSDAPFTASLRVRAAMTGSLHISPAEWEGLRLWLDPGDAPPEVVADVLRALSDLHMAAGGTGLQFSIDEDECHVIASAEEVV